MNIIDRLRELYRKKKHGAFGIFVNDALVAYDALPKLLDVVEAARNFSLDPCRVTERDLKDALSALDAEAKE